MKGAAMKKAMCALLTAFLLLGLCSSVFADETPPLEVELQVEPLDTEPEAEAEGKADRECEWNVLLYVCGTDLESVYGAATKNLKAIAETLPCDDVNLLVETGGSKEWDPNEEMDLEISNQSLQRWYYGKDGFVLVDEVQEACMASKQTLSDFIRWAAENYSAKKNMLVLWDHGGGSNSGILVDENYNDAIMPVYALEDALCDGGTHFDLLLTDACLMATLEVCQALSPYVDYLAASEEVMAGDGTNYKSWVQYLYERPECSAVQLGKRICDSTQQYYMETGQMDAASYFTMSLIDLSVIDEVAEAFNAFMHEVANLIPDPLSFYKYARATYFAENYAENRMYDLFDLSLRAEKGGIPKEVTHALQDAVEDAVVYNARSTTHTHSHGLSVYYTLNDSNNGFALDHFARTCKNPEYLAFLDGISINWDAPDWVYELTERHAELDRASYFPVMETACAEDGSEATMTLTSGDDAAVFAGYELRYMDPDSGVIYSLGESGDLIPRWDEEAEAYRYELTFDGSWPSMEGNPLCMSIAEETDQYILYNVPIEFGGQRSQMRVLENYAVSDEQSSETEEDGEAEDGTEAEAEDEYPFELLGIWDGFDAHTGLPGRNLFNLSDGADITLYDAVYSALYDRIMDYVEREELSLTKDSVIEKGALPKGQYLIRFVVRDVFNTAHYSDAILANWDGETVSFEMNS